MSSGLCQLLFLTVVLVTGHVITGWVCRNGPLHAGVILVVYIFPDWPSCISLVCTSGHGSLPNHSHYKHSTPSPSLYCTMQKVPIAKWTNCVPCPLKSSS